MNAREYNFWFVFQRAEDVPGEWVGHCLELDVVSQGNSLKHAMNMLGEACAMTICEDVISGRDPLDRRAPEECWKSLYSIVSRGKPMSFATLDESKVHSTACQVELRIVFEQAVARPATEPLLADIPLTWAEVPTQQQTACRC